MRLWLYHSTLNWRHNSQIATDEVFDSEHHLIGQTLSPCYNQPMNFSPDTLWILSFLFTARLSGISKVSLDRVQIVLCLSVCPWALKDKNGIVKKKKKQKGKKAIPFPGLIIEALGSDMSWLKQHHFCHSCLATDLTNDAVGSPPDAIKYGVKQEGLPSALLFQPLLVPTPWPRCFFLKSKVQWHFSIFFFYLWWFWSVCIL